MDPVITLGALPPPKPPMERYTLPPEYTVSVEPPRYEVTPGMVAPLDHGSTVDRQREILLMAHLVRLVEIMEAGQDMLRHVKEPFQSDPVLPILWVVAQEHWRKYKAVPPAPFLKLAASDKVSLLMLPISEEAIEKTLIDVFNIMPEQLSPKWAAEILTQMRDDALTVQLAAQLQGSDNPVQLIKSAAKTLETQSVSRPVVVSDIHALNIGEKLAGTAKVPLNLSFLDEHLGGGLARGESMLMVIPSGGGKTTLALQIAKATALGGGKCVIALLEQPVGGDIMLRLCVSASNSTRNEWTPFARACDAAKARGEATPTPDKYVSAQTFEEWNRCGPLYANKLVILDFASSSTPIKSMVSIYEAVARHDQETGTKTDLLIVDWWGVLSDRMATANPGLGESGVRALKRDCLSRLASLNKQYGDLRLIVFHQLSGQASKKTGRVTAKDAQEDANLDNYFDHAFAVSTMDGQNRALVAHSKARSSDKKDFRWQLDGERCLIKALNPEHGAGPLTARMAAAMTALPTARENFRL